MNTPRCDGMGGGCNRGWGLQPCSCPSASPPSSTPTIMLPSSLRDAPRLATPPLRLYCTCILWAISLLCPQISSPEHSRQRWRWCKRTGGGASKQGVAMQRMELWQKVKGGRQGGAKTSDDPSITSFQFSPSDINAAQWTFGWVQVHSAPSNFKLVCSASYFIWCTTALVMFNMSFLTILI